jgi:hypothetical protein
MSKSTNSCGVVVCLQNVCAEVPMNLRKIRVCAARQYQVPGTTWSECTYSQNFTQIFGNRTGYETHVRKK